MICRNAATHVGLMTPLSLGCLLSAVISCHSSAGCRSEGTRLPLSRMWTCDVCADVGFFLRMWVSLDVRFPRRPLHFLFSGCNYRCFEQPEVEFLFWPLAAPAPPWNLGRSVSLVPKCWLLSFPCDSEGDISGIYSEEPGGP